MNQELLKIEKRQSFVNGMMVGTIVTSIIISILIILTEIRIIVIFEKF